MIEAALVYDQEGKTLAWHLPPCRTAGSIPDTRSLWDLVWEFRDVIGGIAHTHPGSGPTGPSMTDITTFSALERALGKRLHWWIFTADQGACVKWVGPEKYSYARCDSPPFNVVDTDQLREYSCYPTHDVVVDRKET